MTQTHEYFRLNHSGTINTWNTRDGGRVTLPDRTERTSEERPTMRQIAAARGYKSKHPARYKHNGIGIWQER
jgi:hypothetical protein